MALILSAAFLWWEPCRGARMGLVGSGPRETLGLRTSASVLVLLDFIHPLKFESLFFLNLQFLKRFSR